MHSVVTRPKETQRSKLICDFGETYFAKMYSGRRVACLDTDLSPPYEGNQEEIENGTKNVSNCPRLIRSLI